MKTGHAKTRIFILFSVLPNDTCTKLIKERKMLYEEKSCQEVT